LDNWFCVVYLPPTLLWAGGLSFTGQTGESSNKMDVKLYVGNLAKSTTEDELKTLFMQTGPVALVEVIKDRDSGQSKGFAFITMNDQAQADNAITKFNGFSMGGNELKVNIAKPKVERSGSGRR
jgi:RNA recognition motif-containing protein